MLRSNSMRPQFGSSARHPCKARGLALIATAASFMASAAGAGICAAPTEVSFPSAPAQPLLAACGAQPPTVGGSFRGTVLQVIDGRTFCVAQGPMPADRIRVTIADASPGSTRQTLMARSFAREVTCVATRSTQTELEARCVVDGAPIDDAVTTEARR